jgi:hypothetical protein
VVAKKQFMDQMQKFSEKVIMIRNQAYLAKSKASLEKKEYEIKTIKLLTYLISFKKKWLNYKISWIVNQGW